MSTYFGELLKKDYGSLVEDEEEQKDYPGSTPPRNRADSPIPHALFDEALADAKPKQFSVNGELRDFYTIGDLAKALKRKAVTIRAWERNGWIPVATFRTQPPRGQQVPGVEPKGRRLYSREQVEFLLTAVEMHRLNEPNEADWDGFKTYAVANWPG
tara:strand:+ start:235 stop:705 length:471 start_codon:yes stop_codon:yes gene_type:complete